MSTEEKQGFSFIAPSTDGVAKKERLETVQIIPPGAHPAILYGMVDLGTHADSWKGVANEKRKLKLIFELPLFKQKFYAEDKEERPSTVQIRMNNIFSENSQLKLFVEDALGIKLSREDYKNGYDVGQLLNKAFIIQIEHSPNKKEAGKVWENIKSIAPIDDRAKQTYNFEWDKVVPHNKTLAFAIAPDFSNFNSDSFARVWSNDKKMLKDSQEGLEHARRGGEFQDRLLETTEAQAITPKIENTPQQQSGKEDIFAGSENI